MASINEPPRSLLFLTPASSTPTTKDLLALGPSISFALQDISKSASSGKSAILDIALISTSYSGKESPLRSYSYSRIQAEIAAIYKVLCLALASEQSKIPGQSEIDVRVLVLCPSLEEITLDQGPHASLFSLAKCQRKWQNIYALDDDTGHLVVKLFERWASTADEKTHWQIQYTPSQSSSEPLQKSPKRKTESSDSQQYQAIAVGGTFDHLHAGHKLLLTMTASLLDTTESSSNGSWKRLIIGITGDELLTKKKYAEYLESWTDRQFKVSQFLQDIINFSPSNSTAKQTHSQDMSGPEGRAIHYFIEDRIRIECVEIKDPFGPTILDPHISALVLSGETRDGGQSINIKRREKGWADLEVYEVDVLDAELPAEDTTRIKQTFEGKISSTELRRLESIRRASMQQPI